MRQVNWLSVITLCVALIWSWQWREAARTWEESSRAWEAEAARWQRSSEKQRIDVVTAEVLLAECQQRSAKVCK